MAKGSITNTVPKLSALASRGIPVLPDPILDLFSGKTTPSEKNNSVVEAVEQLHQSIEAENLSDENLELGANDSTVTISEILDGLKAWASNLTTDNS